MWVCENNQYGMGTTVERASAVIEIRQKAEGYCIPNSRVDGMDVLAVRKAAEEAIAQVRSGNGPYFLEVMTYRYRGHSMGDPERYRSSAEVKKWQEDDPIGVYHRYLLEQKIATEEELERSTRMSCRRFKRRSNSLRAVRNRRLRPYLMTFMQINKKIGISNLGLGVSYIAILVPNHQS